MDWLAAFLFIMVSVTIIYGIGYCVGYEKGTDERDAISEIEAARLALKVKSCQIEAAVLRGECVNLNRIIKAMEGASK